jgi:hypothetical protein
MAYPVTISPYWNSGPAQYPSYPGYYARPAYSPYVSYPASYVPVPRPVPVYVPVPVMAVPSAPPGLSPPSPPGLPKLDVLSPATNTTSLVPNPTAVVSADPVSKVAVLPTTTTVLNTVNDEDKRLLEAIHKLRENNPKLRAMLTPDNIAHLEQGFKSPESSLKMALDLTIGDSLRDELHHKRWWRRKAARSAVKQFETAMTFMPIPGPIKRRVKDYLDELRIEKVSPVASANANLKAALNQAVDTQA